MLIKSLKIVLLTSFIQLLVACGGGVNVADNGGGITGTGITMGRITEFGSIYVNGIRFDIENASFLRDGVSSVGQEDFHIGEYVVITGNIDASTTSGVASQVVFVDLLEGAVTKVSTDNQNIEILGQNVRVDSITTFNGVTDLSSLVQGNIVEVSGIKDASGLIRATSITLKQEVFVAGVSENELKGTISRINAEDQTLVINNILVDYSGAQLDGFDELRVSQFIEVNSNSSINGNILIANQIELENEVQNISENTKIEIEGIVTRFVSTEDFDLNQRAVTTNNATKYKHGVATNIHLNASLEIKGIINANGLLVAEKVEFKAGDSDDDEDNSGQHDSANDSGDSGTEDSVEGSNTEDNDSEDITADENNDDSNSEDDHSNNNEEDSSENDGSEENSSNDTNDSSSEGDGSKEADNNDGSDQNEISQESDGENEEESNTTDSESNVENESQNSASAEEETNNSTDNEADAGEDATNDSGEDTTNDSEEDGTQGDSESSN